MENVATEEFISRTEALEDFESCNAENPYWTPQRVKTLLLRQPAADVAEVVRCKDCKMWEKQNIFEHSDTGRMRRGGYCMCSRFTRYEDDFCSFGEYQTNTGGIDNVSD